MRCKRPGFIGPRTTAATAVALGVAATVAAFAIVRTTLLPDLPFSREGELVEMRLAPADTPQSTGVPPTLSDIDAVRASGVVELRTYQLDYPLVDVGAGARHVFGAVLEAGFMEFLGSRPVLGTTAGFERAPTTTAPVVLVSDSFWRTYLEADANCVGRPIIVDDVPHTIVGVMPPSFHFPLVPSRLRNTERQLWRPFQRTAERTPDSVQAKTASQERRAGLSSQRLGSQRSDASLSRASAGTRTTIIRLSNVIPLDQLRTRIAQALSEQGATRVGRLLLVPIRKEAREEHERSLLMLQLLALLLLVIGLASGVAASISSWALRQEESRVRIALGAEPLDVFIEALRHFAFFSLPGLALGLLLGLATLPLIREMAGEALPPYATVHLDATGVASVFAVCVLLAGCAAAAASAVMTRLAHTATRKPRTSLPFRLGTLSIRVFESVSLIQVGLSVCLLVTGMLFGRTVFNLLTTDRGFDGASVVIAEVMARPRPGAPERLGGLAKAIVEACERVSGVESAAVATAVPFAVGQLDRVVLQSPAGKRTVDEVHVLAVTERYLQTFRIPALRMLDGRPGQERDAIASESLGALVPGGLRLGETTAAHQGRPRTIAGLVRSTREFARSTRPMPQLYVPFHTAPSALMRVAVRFRSGWPPAGRLLESAIRGVSADLAVNRVTSAEALLWSRIATERFILTTGGGLAAMATVIAFAGMYTTFLAAAVGRTRELVVRRALGATGRALLLQYVCRVAVILFIGAALGGALAFPIVAVVSDLLFEVGPADQWTLLAVASFLCGAAGAAALGPMTVWRSLRLADLLRHD